MLFNFQFSIGEEPSFNCHLFLFINHLCEMKDVILDMIFILENTILTHSYVIQFLIGENPIFDSHLFLFMCNERCNIIYDFHLDKFLV